MRLLFNLGFRGKLRDGMMKIPINLGYDNKGDETELTLDKKGLEIALPKFTFAQKEKGNCVQLLGFIADPETLALPYDETDHIILKGQFIDVANKEVFERKLDLSEFTYKIDDDFMHASYEKDRFILRAVEQPMQKEGTLSITYEGDIHEQAKSTIEVPLEIEDFDELKPVAIVDDDPQKQRMQLYDLPVLGKVADIQRVVRQKNIEHIVIAIPSLANGELQKIVDECHQTNVQVQMIPKIEDLMTGRVSVSHLKNIEVEDLLGRDPVKLDLDSISSNITGKVVMVTGAGGSIGSELCRQLLNF